MRILFCRSNPIAPDPRVEKEARALIHAGHSVAVLGWDRSGALSRQETNHEINIFRLAIKAGYATGLGNFPQLLKWELGLCRWLISHRIEYDCIHACDFDTVLPALLAKWLFQKVVVYDIFDFYADHLRKVPPWIKNIIRRIDLWAIEQADAVILADEARLRQINGSKPRRIITIYNSPEDIELLFQRDGIFSPSTKLGIAYVGLLQVERGLFEMLQVLQKHPEWELAAAGFGGDQEKFLESAKNLPNFYWFGRVPYEQAMKISAAADVLFATYDPTIPNHAYSSPNKIFESMMLGKPIIVAKGTNIDRIVETYHNGMVVRYGNIEDLGNALLLLSNDPNLKGKLGKNARRAYDEVYGWEKMRSRLIALYDDLKPLLQTGKTDN